jgi:STE24 endopeptidase
MNTFTYLFLLFLTVSYAVEYWLSYRQKHHVLQHRSAVPAAFQATINLETHQKAADYTVEKNKLGNLESVVGVVML